MTGSEDLGRQVRVELRPSTIKPLAFSLGSRRPAQARSNLPARRSEAFLQGLRELGYLAGKNITIAWKNVQGRADLLPAAAVKLVG
jgi:hypothetical protein